jgi:hypothetical protein
VAVLIVGIGLTALAVIRPLLTHRQATKLDQGRRR